MDFNGHDNLLQGCPGDRGSTVLRRDVERSEVIQEAFTRASECRRAGRPRDPDLEDRALQATLEVFGERGWAGLTIGEVASRARVGKSSIYLRWSDKGSLLACALRYAQTGRGDGADPGTDAAQSPPPDPYEAFRSSLYHHTLRRGELYTGPFGLAMLRLYIECKAHPDTLAEVRQEAFTRFVLEERAHVQQAIADGVLRPDTSAVHLLDAIEGAVLMHVLVTPPELADRVRASLPEYVTRLVDTQLAAIRTDAGGERR